MTSTPLSPTDYYATLPKCITGAGLYLHDEQGRVLLVHPTYRADGTWEIPGGGLDDGENPWQAAAREAREELGLDLTPGRLLVVDWVPAQPDGRPALANYLFDGGQLTSTQLEQIRLPTHELSEWRLTTPEQWPTLLADHMVRRLQACTEALDTKSTAYLNHGRQPTISAR
ncbi:hypothetical protein Acy02nite_89630 [Actinoplanes cyaneus]|uniref:Nudix hydrolase domain-containing protein n=1 Tax=Actinoplanes cyaneus TaxID=52696 RepID=A0A919ITN1_9ACTN|nr:NUDIX hydrolase [Actinoplanes cyaneus]MCW2144326.1 8-oxo-dGTP pyrophosphatase MutT, NUDIX family [Actinoplanes cyaneus]GID71082.1 hypothetical protein Acy02nite_89630 [Actinoplanes cyaneus]